LLYNGQQAQCLCNEWLYEPASREIARRFTGKGLRSDSSYSLKIVVRLPPVTQFSEDQAKAGPMVRMHPLTGSTSLSKRLWDRSNKVDGTRPILTVGGYSRRVLSWPQTTLEMVHGHGGQGKAHWAITVDGKMVDGSLRPESRTCPISFSERSQRSRSRWSRVRLGRIAFYQERRGVSLSV
jgi:hypothetical protein